MNIKQVQATINIKETHEIHNMNEKLTTRMTITENGDKYDNAAN